MELKSSCIRRFHSALDAVGQLVRERENDLPAVPILVAIDGRCGGGKTTLGEYLRKHFECNVFHMDDFYLQPHQRTVERLREVGGNVDYERFLTEVLEPLQNRQDVHYRKFSCRTWEMEPEMVIPYRQLNIIEGSYSLHPYFGNPYGLRIFMDIDEKSQSENILHRNGEKKLEEFKRLWIPKEEAYFEKFQVGEGCLVIRWEPPKDM
ncbi:MAG: hypothetical protein HFH23_07570 [Ruminococcus sp.]|nr:hypothetical protein [Ruminococcus sp.]